MHACAASDDLLEFRHGTDRTVEHDQATGLCVHTRGKQAGSRHENGIFCFRVYEIPQLRLPFIVATSDSHHVAVIFVAQVFVLIDQSLAHARGMLFINAKHNRFLETVVALFQEVRDFLGNELGAVVDNEGTVEILGVVNAVFDLVAVPVHISPLRPVAFNIHIDMDLHNLVRRKEAVRNTLPERVGVNGTSKIIDI